MVKKEIINSYIDNMIYFFFCLLCLFLPISNAVISVSFGLISALYIAKFFLYTQKKEILKELLSNKLSIYIIIFILCIGLSVFVSGQYFKKSFDAWYSKWLEGVLLFYFSYFIFKKKSVKLPLYSLIIATCLIGINGVFQKIHGIDFIRENKLVDVACYNFHAICSTFSHYNGFASFMAVMFFIIFGFILDNIKTTYNKFTFKNTVLVLSLFLIIYCIIFSYSRGGWLGLIFGFFIMSIISIYNNQYKYISSLSFLAVCLFMLILFNTVPFKERAFAIFKGGNTSRFETWTIAIAMFKESPILGKGIGTFLKHLPSYSNIYNQYAHNSYLQLLVESGIIGLTPFLLIILRWVTESLSFIKSNKENFIFLGIFCGLCAFMLHAFFDNQLFSLKLTTLFWLLLGTSASFLHSK